MGMFDVVLVPCPECGTKHEAQTKSGDCVLQWYEWEDAPADVLLDVNRHAPFICDNCNASFSATDTNLYERASVLLNTVLTWEDNLSEQGRDSLLEVKRLLARMNI